MPRVKLFRTLARAIRVGISLPWVNVAEVVRARLIIGVVDRARKQKIKGICMVD